MNNIVIKNIAFVASGGLFGALGGYLVTKKVLSEKFEAELEEYKVSVEDRVKDALDRIEIYEQAGLTFETAKAIAESNKKLAEKKEKELESKNVEEEKKEYSDIVNYAGYGKEKNNDIYKEEHKVEPIVEDFTPSEPVKVEEPYLISVDQFISDDDGFSKVSCTFYTEDYLICETAHNMKIDIRHVGQENIDMMLNSDIEVMYVRNEYLNIDYEIDKYEGSYSYEVLGDESLNE